MKISEPDAAEPEPDSTARERLLIAAFALYALLALGYCAYRLVALNS